MTERYRLEDYKLRRIQEAAAARTINRLSTFNPIRPHPPEIKQDIAFDLTPNKLIIASSGLLRIQKDLEKLKVETYSTKLLPMFQVKRGNVTREVTHEIVPSGKEINIFSGFTLLSASIDLNEHHLSVYKHQSKVGILPSNVWCIQSGRVDSTTWEKTEPGVIFIFQKKPSTYVIREIYHLGEKASFSSSSIGEWTKHVLS